MINLPLSNSYFTDPDGNSEGSAAKSATVNGRRTGGGSGFDGDGVRTADMILSLRVNKSIRGTRM